MKARIQSFIKIMVKRLESFTDRVWYGPLIALLALLDNWILLVPTDGILVSSIFLQPKRWLAFALCIALGSTLGAASVGFFAHLHGMPFIESFLPDLLVSSAWQLTEGFFRDYGVIVVFLVGLTPFFQQPAIVLAALANTPIWQLFWMALAGRVIKYLIIGYLSSHAPKLVIRLWGLRGELKDAGAINGHNVSSDKI